MGDRDKIFLSIILIGVAIFVTLLVTEQVYNVKYLAIIGVAIMVVLVVGTMIAAFVFFIKDLNKELKKNSKKERTPKEDEKLLNNIYTAKNNTEREIAKAAYIGEGCDSAGEIILSSFGLSKEARNCYKGASPKDKFLTVFVYVFLIMCILAFGVGAVFCNISVTIGLIIMGVSVSGFFGFIVVSVIVNKVQHNNFYKTPKIKTKTHTNKKRKKLEDNTTKNEIKSAIVKRCFNHSVGRNGQLFCVWVYNQNEKYDFKMITNKHHEKGDVVYYYQNGNKRTVVEDYENSLEK